jgi:HK97 family phage major capsid protein
MITLAELRAKRDGLIADAKAIVNKAPSRITAEDNATFDLLMEQVDSINDELQRSELSPQTARIRAGFDTVHELGRRRDVTPEYRAFDNFLRNGMGGLTSEDRAVMMKLHDPKFQAAQGVGTDSAGGFAVPPEHMRTLVEALKSTGGLMAAATIIPSDTGADLPIPTDNETTQEGALVAENVAHAEQDITLDSVILSSFMYSSKIVRVSIQLMEDSGFDFGAYVMRKLGMRIGRITNRHWILGSGVAQPRGVAVAAATGVKAVAPTSIVLGEIMSLFFSVDPIYRNSKSAGWLLNDVTLAILRKMVDTTGRPLLGDLSSGAADMLMGKPIIVDPLMPAMTAGLKPLIFGDLSAYHIRLVKQTRVLRLSKRYAEFLQVGFLGFLRADGNLVDGGGNAVKCLLMAAA